MPATRDVPPWNARLHGASRFSGRRTSYEVDRDRIVHAAAFRQLQHKTQVQGLLGPERGASFRTRLNHVIEVGQIGRGIASELGANKPLVEAIALAHDLGHPPFGHAGERALNALLVESGGEGWNANLHSLTVVDVVEVASTDYEGLNLTFAVREGIARHATPFDVPVASGPLAKTPSSGIESQIVDVADIFAYLSHDLDDALAAGFLWRGDLASTSPLMAEIAVDAEGRWEQRQLQLPEDDRDRVVNRMIVATLIGECVRDIAESSRQRLAALDSDESAIRMSPRRTVVQSSLLAEATSALLDLLTARYYRSDRVRQADEAAASIIRTLFDWCLANEARVPERLRGPDAATSAATWIASLNDYEAARTAQAVTTSGSATV